MARVAVCLEITQKALLYQIDHHPELQLAKNLADQFRTEISLSSFIFSRLSKEAQETWNQIQTAKNAEKLEAIFMNKPRKIRQSLFVFALVTSSFDLSEACRMVGIPRGTLDAWRIADPRFADIIREIEWHKKNFFESRLVQLVEQNHPGAVIFVNRTLNADRGYSEKIQLQHSGSIETGFSIDQLDLDLETKKKVLAAIRKKKTEPVGSLASRPSIPIQAEIAA